MKTVDLDVAASDPARFISQAEAGEVFIITRGGVPVARLGPIVPTPAWSPEREAAWNRIERRFDDLAAIAPAPESAGSFVREPFDRDALHER